MRKSHNSSLFPSRPKSLYDINDYRSCLFKGDWAKHMVDDMVKKAIALDIDLFEAVLKSNFPQKEHIPPRLYKFYPFNENSLKCIEQNSIYLNDPNNFNDPFDCYIQANEQDFTKRYFLECIRERELVKSAIIDEDDCLSIISSVCYDTDKYLWSTKKQFREVLREIRLKWDYPLILSQIESESYEHFATALQHLRENNMRISSFSAFSLEKLSKYTEMWGHYSNSHKGFCVEYDFSSFISKINEGKADKEEIGIMNCLFPCLYKSTPTFIAPLIFYKYALDRKLTLHQNITLQKDILKTYVSKSTSWSYENEWRIVMPQKISKIWNHLIPFPYAKKIYLGVNMPKDNKEYMYKLCDKLNIEAYETYLDEYNYELVFGEVEIKKYFKNQKDKRESQLNNLNL